MPSCDARLGVPGHIWPCAFQTTKMTKPPRGDQEQKIFPRFLKSRELARVRTELGPT